MVAKAPSSRGTWGAEISATLALAWPIILTNVAQVGLATTDVVMMGWLGPDALAAGALAVNLNFAFLIFAIGVVTATAPLIAIELGRNRHSVRDVRRTIAPGLLGGDRHHPADLGRALALRGDLPGARPAAAHRRQGRRLSAHLPVVVPAFPVLPDPAQFRLGAGAPADRAVGRRQRAVHQRRPGLDADVRPLRPARHGPARRRHRHHAHQHLHGRLAWRRSSPSTGASAAITCSAASGGRTGRASAPSGGSACRSA